MCPLQSNCFDNTNEFRWQRMEEDRKSGPCYARHQHRCRFVHHWQQQVGHPVRPNFLLNDQDSSANHTIYQPESIFKPPTATSSKKRTTQAPPGRPEASPSNQQSPAQPSQLQPGKTLAPTPRQASGSTTPAPTIPSSRKAMMALGLTVASRALPFLARRLVYCLGGHPLDRRSDCTSRMDPRLQAWWSGSTRVDGREGRARCPLRVGD